MSTLSKNNMKYFVGTSIGEARIMDVSDIEVGKKIIIGEKESILKNIKVIVTVGDFVLEYVDSPHHTQTIYRISCSDYSLLLSGERQSLGNDVLHSPFKFLIYDIRLERGRKFASVNEMKQCFAAILAGLRVYGKNPSYDNPDFKNMITISLWPGLKKMFVPEILHEIPSDGWRAKT